MMYDVQFGAVPSRHTLLFHVNILDMMAKREEQRKPRGCHGEP